MIHDCTKWSFDSDQGARAESFQYRVLEMCMADTARMNINCIGDEGDDIRIRPNVFQLASQIILLPLIIGIEKSYPSAIGPSYPCVSRCTHPTIRLMDDGYSCAILLKRLPRRIGRTVVDNNNLVIVETLSKNTIDGFGDEAHPVVSRYDNRKHGADFSFTGQGRKILEDLVSGVVLRWIDTSILLFPTAGPASVMCFVTINIELQRACRGRKFCGSS